MKAVRKVTEQEKKKKTATELFQLIVSLSEKEWTDKS